jgi:hypothetical protein
MVRIGSDGAGADPADRHLHAFAGPLPQGSLPRPLRFAASVFGVLYGIFVPWLILRRRWSAGFRDRAEAVFGSPFLQGFIYMPPGVTYDIDGGQQLVAGG